MWYTFGQRLLAAGGRGEKLLAFRNGLATEANTLLRVKDRAFPHQSLDTTGTTIYLIEGHLIDNLGAMLPIL
jgi:hypothetical protein